MEGSSKKKIDVKQLQLVPESLLKKRHDVEEMKAHRAAQHLLHRSRETRKVFSASGKHVKIQKPETYLARARSRKHHAARFHRVRKKGLQSKSIRTLLLKTKTVTTDDNEEKEVVIRGNSVGAKLVFCIRIRNEIGMPDEIKKVLGHLRLRDIYKGVFLKFSDTVQKQLHLVHPWVVYGGPLPESIVMDLLTRRGHIRLKGSESPQPLSNNVMLEQALANNNQGDDTGILCLQDLVHEITTVGDSFTKANSLLCPFVLTGIHSKFQEKKLGKKGGKVYGDVGEEILDWIRDML